MIRTRFFVALLAVAMASSLAATDADAQRYDPRQAPPFTPQWAAPQLDVYPTAGGPGTEVVIRGARFHDRTRVFYGDVPMPILERGKKEIVAVIPRGAYGDRFIYVVDETGQARTAYPFALEYGPPDRDRRGYDRYDRHDRRRYDRYDRDDRRRWELRSFDIQPRRGDPGTPVLIHGRRFSPDAVIYYGDQPMRVLRRGPSFIVAEVPRDARSGDYIYVVDQRGESRSARSFSLTDWRRW